MKSGSYENDTAGFSSEVFRIPKQYMHIQKEYLKSSPIRNKKNLLKARGKTNESFNGENSHAKSSNSAAEDFFSKILAVQKSNKENASTRYFSARKNRILSELPEKFASFHRMEHEEISADYKLTQLKIHSITRSKLPPSLIKFRHKKKF